MGRRKAAKKVIVKRKKWTVAKTFKCLFCNHDEAVACKMDFKTMTAELNCRICDAKFQTTITSLSAPIDVFSEWLDETHEQQEGLRKGSGGIKRRVGDDTVGGRDGDDGEYGVGDDGGYSRRERVTEKVAGGKRDRDNEDDDEDDDDAFKGARFRDSGADNDLDDENENAGNMNDDEDDEPITKSSRVSIDNGLEDDDE